MRMRFVSVLTAGLLSVLGVVVAGSEVLAHPGGTAADGCHYCRTNCDSWGEAWNQRHCHGGGSSGGGGTTTPPPPPPPPPPPADTTPPDRPVVSSGDLTGTTMMLRVTAEQGSTIRVTTEDATLASANATGASQEVPVALPGDGKWRLGVVAVDAAGNVSPSASVTVTVDTTAPVADLDIVGPTPNEPRTRVLILGESGATWDLVVEGSSTIRENGKLSGDEAETLLELPSGEWRLALTVTDSAGNAATAEETIVVDVPAPQRPELEILDVREGTVTVRVTGTPRSGVVVSGGSGTELATAVLDEEGVADVTVELPEGRHQLHATASNFSGGRSDASTAHDLALDWTSPTVRVTSAVGQRDGSVIVMVEVDDPEARVFVHDVERVGSGELVLQGMASGEHEIRLAAVDAAGNEFEDVLTVLIPRDESALAGFAVLVALGAGGYGAWRWRRRVRATATPPPPSGPPSWSPPPPPPSR